MRIRRAAAVRAGAAIAALAGLAVLAIVASAAAPEPVRYRFTIPQPEHHWMQVEATFPGLGTAPLDLHMSRSSPGRYSLHDFAKNVYDVHVAGSDGKEIALTRPDPSSWEAAGHGGTATVHYKIYGDTVDGTFLAIDRTHLHMNMPAAIMWARGLDDRPAVLTFDPPTGTRWQIATQLHPGASPFEYTAPNLQYLMDSPVEFGPIAMRQFTVDGHVFRFAVHHQGTDTELDAFVKKVERVVQQEEKVFGEFPDYDPGRYTFIADYLPWANGDGMEHRNSTVMTSSGSLATSAGALLDTVAHEFFHNWNVERIRPKGLEPFDLDRADMSDSLWLAEGFTQYYGPLALRRAGLVNLDDTARTFEDNINAVVNGPGREVRSAEQMSQMAPFVDGGRPEDRTNWSNTYISYYSYGAAIALALDLSLRERSGGRVSLDDFMRAMWVTYGKPGGSREGYVDHPYTIDDAEATLGQVSGDPAFAHDFFSRYIEGHDAADYAKLLAPAGLLVRRAAAGRAWLGNVRFESNSRGDLVAGLVAPDAPVYAAGLDQDDVVEKLDGQTIESIGDVGAIVERHRPGDRLDMTYVDRNGDPVTASVTLGEEPYLSVVPVESTGVAPTADQKTFRAAWLGAH
jgi:predicted metalloprotease with PDZ domain